MDVGDDSGGRFRPGFRRKGFSGMRKLAVPEAIKGLGRFWHDWAYREDIEIDEIIGFPKAKILVPDVPASHDRELIVDDECLVVHSSIELSETREDLESRSWPFANVLWIENPDLDIRVMTNRSEFCFVVFKEKIVDENPDPHASLRRFEDAGEKEGSRLVGIP